MINIKIIKEPGFLYDLNYLFYAKFNTQICVDMVVDESKREAYSKHLKEIFQRFGDISDELYVFYHALKNDRCFITTCYMDSYKDCFTKDFDFKAFKNLLCNTEGVIQNMIRFYLNGLSEEELAECLESTSALFARIKRSSHSSEEKSKLYEFFIDPIPYIHALQHELIEKEVLLSAYYQEHYGKILEAHNNTTFEMLCEPVKGNKDLSFLKDSGQMLCTSYCLLNKYFMKIFFISSGAVYLLGIDYSLARTFADKNKMPSLDDICSALSDVSRLKMLELLLERTEMTCKDFEKQFRFSGSTAYHHLTVLTGAGVLKVRNEGKTIYYSINRKCFDNMRSVLKKYSND